METSTDQEESINPVLDCSFWQIPVNSEVEVSELHMPYTAVLTVCMLMPIITRLILVYVIHTCSTAVYIVSLHLCTTIAYRDMNIDGLYIYIYRSSVSDWHENHPVGWCQKTAETSSNDMTDFNCK